MPASCSLPCYSDPVLRRSARSADGVALLGGELAGRRLGGVIPPSAILFGSPCVRCSARLFHRPVFAYADGMLTHVLCPVPSLSPALLPQPDGLTLEEFVEVMMKYLPTAKVDPMTTVSDLCELFAQVDVNGDGTMEWDEFSAFCIEAGMAANMFKSRKVRRFLEHTSFTRLTPHGLHISRVRYVPRLQKLVSWARAARGTG